jgi:hypothetical protein
MAVLLCCYPVAASFGVSHSMRGSRGGYIARTNQFLAGARIG